MAPAFGRETNLVIARDTDEALLQLESFPVQVLIIDAKTTDPKQNYYEQYYDEKENVPFIELSQYAGQLNNGLSIILLVNKLHASEGDFARKCGAMLIMDRKNILINRMVYLIEVLRKRTFRTILGHDIPLGTVFSVDLYHYLSLSNRYAVSLPAGTPFSAEKKEKMKSSNIRHFYTLEADLSIALSTLRSSRESLLFSEILASIRNQYRQLLIQLFDLSTDGMINFGKDFYELGLEITAQLEKLVARFPDPLVCLQELPYPRYSPIAHSINCGIYALVFSRHCQMEARNEIAFSAMIHNVGLCEINHELRLKSERDLSAEEFEQYKLHVTMTLDMLRKKFVPFTPLIEKTIYFHHENYDGTGFPEGLAGENIPPSSALLSILASFDYFNSVRPNERPRSLIESWQLLKEHHTEGTVLSKKFNPRLLAQLDEFFRGH